MTALSLLAAAESMPMLHTQEDIIVLPAWAVGLAALLMVVQGAISLKLDLGMHWQLAVALVRSVVQLSALGYILLPIFNYGRWWLVLSYAGFMIYIAAVEALSRPAYTYKGMFINTLLTMVTASGGVMAYALLVVMRVHPWWEPQYLIPILGMVLGNTMSGISIGLATCLEELKTAYDNIEKLLALGASRYEATHGLVQRSVRVAMTPLLNQMNVVGLVSIPGMMTGQILSGSDPSQAARYQMVIMFLLGATSTLASFASIYAAVMVVVDGCHRYRGDRLQPRSGNWGVSAAIKWVVLAVAGGIAAAWNAVTGCCRSRPRGDGSGGRTGSSMPPEREPLLSNVVVVPDGVYAAGAGGASHRGATLADGGANGGPLVGQSKTETEDTVDEQGTTRE